MSEETNRLLQALLEGQKEISADVKSIDERVQRLEGSVQKLEDGQNDMQEQLTKIEGSIDLLAQKDWHHEKEINFVKKQVEHFIKEA